VEWQAILELEGELESSLIAAIRGAKLYEKKSPAKAGLFFFGNPYPGLDSNSNGCID
jgi:hypothetical protein